MFYYKKSFNKVKKEAKYPLGSCQVAVPTLEAGPPVNRPPVRCLTFPEGPRGRCLARQPPALIPSGIIHRCSWVF